MMTLGDEIFIASSGGELKKEISRLDFKALSEFSSCVSLGHKFQLFSHKCHKPVRKSAGNGFKIVIFSASV